VPMPPQLAHWAHAADIAPMPEGLAISIRQLLGRGTELSPRSWRGLVVDLADRPLSYVAPPPPRGTPPEQFLAAVAAERRERDRGRLHREAELRHRLGQHRTRTKICAVPSPRHSSADTSSSRARAGIERHISEAI